MYVSFEVFRRHKCYGGLASSYTPFFGITVVVDSITDISHFLPFCPLLAHLHPTPGFPHGTGCVHGLNFVGDFLVIRRLDLIRLIIKKDYTIG